MSSYKEIWDLRITCADEDLFPPLERNYSCATECARFYGMPVQDKTVEALQISFSVDEEHSLIPDEMLEWWDMSEQEDALFDYISEKVQEIIPCFPTARFIWTVRANQKCEEVVFIAREIVQGLKIMPHIALRVQYRREFVSCAGTPIQA